MKTLVLAGLALPALLIASAVGAADLPRGYAPRYTPPLVPIFTWTGVYAGINGGAGFGSFTGRGNAQAGDPSGGLVGGTIGYNYQLPNNIVVGVEADADYAGVNSTQTTAGPLTVKGTMGFQDTVRGRVGYSINRMLFFATGGYAGGTVHSTVYDTPNNYFNAGSQYLNGFAVGAGAEYAILPNLSGKLEYLYTDLTPAYQFVGSPDVTRIGVSTSNVRAGLNYHF